MPVFNKYNQFKEDLGNKVHDLVGTNDTLKVMLSNTTPNAATHAVRADVSELATANGYTSGGVDIQNDGVETSGTLAVTGVDVTWTASAGDMGPFRYVILYNDTPTSPADPLIGWWTIDEAVTLGIGEVFRARFSGTNVLSIT